MESPLASSLPTPVLAALNHVLDQADWARGKLRPFAGRNVRVQMLPLSFAFAIDADGRLRPGDAEVDLLIVLPANAPLLVLQGGESLMKAVRIEGPADLADTLSLVMQNLRWDIEEDLSKVVGDIAARRIAQGMAAFASWQRQAAHNLAGNVAEYLVHENPTLVGSTEFQAFAKQVGNLRDRLEAAASRVQLLKGSQP